MKISRKNENPFLPKVFTPKTATFGKNRFLKSLVCTRKTVILAILSLLGAFCTPKSRLQNAPTPDPGHPHAPNFHGTPQPPFPTSRAILGAIAGVAREKSAKNVISVGHPHPWPNVPRCAEKHKNRDLLFFPFGQSFWKFQGTLGMV